MGVIIVLVIYKYTAHSAQLQLEKKLIQAFSKLYHHLYCHRKASSLTAVFSRLTRGYLADCHPTEGFLSTWKEVTYLSSILFSLGRLPAAVWAVSFS